VVHASMGSLAGSIPSYLDMEVMSFLDGITSSAPLNRVDLAKVIDQGSEERSRVMLSHQETRNR
jgi:hypothetical protein